jgi:hypothetical protein
MPLLSAVALTLGVTFGAVAASGTGNGPPAGVDCPTGQNVVVHLKRHLNDLQGAQTAVRIATLLASASGPSGPPVNVTLFLTLQGPRLVDSAQPQDLLFGSVPGTLGDETIKFLDAGGNISVCPLCGKEIGLAPGDLLYANEYPDQVKIAGPDDIKQTFLCADQVLDF